MNNKKFKVGDKVLITKPKLDKENYSPEGVCWVSQMDDSIGKIFTIAKIGQTSTSVQLQETVDWYYPLSSLTLVNNEEKKINTLTKNQLLELREKFTCYEWRNSIYEILQDNAIQPDPFTIEQFYINKAIKECTPFQLETLEEYGIVFKKKPEFKEGDFVVVTEFDKTITVDLTIGKVYEIMGLNGKCHLPIKKDDIGHSRTIDTKSLKFRHATEEEIKWKDFPADGTLCFVTCSKGDVWQLRYSNGKGKFYCDQLKSGNNVYIYKVWQIANCTLPE